MKNVKQILTENRGYIIKSLNHLFPGQALTISMNGFMGYCNNYGLTENENISNYLQNFRKQETTFSNLSKSSDINDLTKSIRQNTRNRWGI